MYVFIPISIIFERDIQTSLIVNIFCQIMYYFMSLIENRKISSTRISSWNFDTR